MASPTLVSTCSGRDVPHTGVACLLVVVVVVVSHRRSTLKVLLAPLFAALDTLPIIVDGNIRQRSHIATQGCLPASLGLAKHDHLVASGVLGGDAARWLKCVPTKVTMLTLEQAPCAALRLHARAPLVSLAMGLCLSAPIMPPQ
jgi:hypothetical protein